MTRALFDTNVVLDHFEKREPFWPASTAVVESPTTHAVEGFVAAHAVTTIAYVLRRRVGSIAARSLVGDLLARARVAPVTETVLRHALASPIPDFEDAVCDAVCIEPGLECVVTRNVDDFARASTPAVLPEVFLASIAT